MIIVLCMFLSGAEGVNVQRILMHLQLKVRTNQIKYRFDEFSYKKLVILFYRDPYCL